MIDPSGKVEILNEDNIDATPEMTVDKLIGRDDRVKKFNSLLV